MAEFIVDAVAASLFFGLGFLIGDTWGWDRCWKELTKNDAWRKEHPHESGHPVHVVSIEYGTLDGDETMTQVCSCGHRTAPELLGGDPFACAQLHVPLEDRRAS